VLVALVTKKVIAPVGFDGMVLLLAPQPTATAQIASTDHIFICSVLRRSVACFLPDRLGVG
jgi:hypothetical protein